MDNRVCLPAETSKTLGVLLGDRRCIAGILFTQRSATRPMWPRRMPISSIELFSHTSCQVTTSVTRGLFRTAACVAKAAMWAGI